MSEDTAKGGSMSKGGYFVWYGEEKYCMPFARCKKDDCKICIDEFLLVKLRHLFKVIFA